MVDPNAAVSFMRSTVHISVDHKIHISVIIYIQKLDIMLHSRITEIAVITLAECKNLYEFAGIRCVTPQISVLRKCSYGSLFIRHVIHVFAPDSQKKSAVADHRKRRIKDLRCRTLKIQKTDPRLIVTHPVEICHQIIFCISVFIRCGDLVFNRNTCCRLVDILDDRDPCLG